ncbi:flagellar basal body-associated protein FliL [Peptoanaerobacter stomatis]|uniref:Flagellar protein FliL n=1 Tax=Peptoanaerobacter stomatis TaxID=796937 RepID=G9XAH5_9FIRM|nr:flagellar basal body-associated FliL family protein [Peptoanaerobacter stomatis]EHL19995.1 flagellar basal body-associated protein FliL [Peptoanaerobacter stomatis]
MDSKKFTIISMIIFVLSLLVFVATVVLVFLRPVGGSGDAKESKRKAATQNVEIGDVSTQIGSSGRYYKGHIYLVVTGKKTPASIEEMMPQIKDSIISSISYSEVSSITSKKGLDELKEKIRNNVNEIIGTEDVVGVLFTESILQ